MKTSYPANGREFKKLLTTRGFEVTLTGGGHYKATHPAHTDKPPIRFSATPSDFRWARNTISWIKRTYGINLKENK